MNASYERANESFVNDPDIDSALTPASCGPAAITGAKRNFGRGPDRHMAVSRISPYLRSHLVSAPEVLGRALRAHSASAAEKPIAEVFWRGYWKGWLEHHSDAWHRCLRSAIAPPRVGELASRLFCNHILHGRVLKCGVCVHPFDLGVLGNSCQKTLRKRCRSDGEAYGFNVEIQAGIQLSAAPTRREPGYWPV